PGLSARASESPAPGLSALASVPPSHVGRTRRSAPTLSLIQPIARWTRSVMPSHTPDHHSEILSQFLTRTTPTAINPAIAATVQPIGVVIIAIPSFANAPLSAISDAINGPPIYAPITSSAVLATPILS